MSDKEDEIPMSDDKANLRMKMAAVIPLHDVTGAPNTPKDPQEPRRNVGGRPRKVNLKPTEMDLAYHAEISAQLVQYVEQDTLAQAIDTKKGATDILHNIRHRLAQSAATLDFHRMELEKYGKIQEAATIARHHIAALRELAQLELELDRKSGQIIDLHSEKQQKIFMLLIGKFREIAQEVLPKESFDLLFNRLESTLDGWEDEAESILR